MSNIILKTRLQKVAITGTNMYVTRPVTYSNIGTKELVEHASVDSGMSKALMRAAIDAVMLQVKELLLNGHSIQLGDMGTLRFSVKCKSVDNADDISVNNVKVRRLIFRPSPEMRAEIKKVKFTLDNEDVE